VPFLFKQWGEHVAGELQAHPNYPGSDTAWRVDPRGDRWHDPRETPENCKPVRFLRVGKKAAGRLLDGRTHDEFPLTKLQAAEKEAREPSLFPPT
jgi:protein gp37